MDVAVDATVIGVLASVITFVIELIKSWIPANRKDENSIIFPWRKGGHFHVPNQAFWPTISLILGVLMFIAIRYSMFGDELLATPGYAATGATAAFASSGVYRVKNVLGSATGGTNATNAQNTGPAIVPIDTLLGVAASVTGVSIKSENVTAVDNSMSDVTVNESTPVETSKSNTF